MWNKLRVWMIKKLGGYVHPVIVERVYGQKKHIIPHVAQMEVRLWEFLGIGCEEKEIEIKNQLAMKIAEDIVKNESLYKFEYLCNPLSPDPVYRMTVYVADKH